MQKTTWIMLALVMLVSACSPVSVAPTLSPTATLRGLPSPTANIRPTPSQTPTPRPIGLDKIGSLGGGEDVYTVAWSPDGKTYAFAKSDGTHIFDTVSQKEIKTLPYPGSQVGYSPDSQIIMVDMTLIRISDGAVLGKFDVNIFLYFVHTFSRDSRFFAYADQCPAGLSQPDCKESIHIWDVVAQQEVREIHSEKVNAYVSSLVFDPTGELLLTSGPHGLIYAWDVSTGTLASDSGLQTAIGRVSDLVFSHDGKYLTSFADDEKNFYLFLWDWKTKARRTITGKHNYTLQSIETIAFSADDSQINLIFDDDSVLIYDLATEKISPGEKSINRAGLFLEQMRARGEYIARPESMAYSPDGQTLAVSSRSFSPITLWDLHTHKVRAALDERGTLLKYNHQGNRLIVLRDSQGDSYESADVSIWDMDQNVKLHTFKVPGAGIFDISADDSTLAIPTFNAIQLWDIEKGTLLQSLPTTEEFTLFLSYSADGQSLSTIMEKDLGSWERELSILTWDVATNKQLSSSLTPIHLGNSDRVLDFQHDMLALYQYAPDTHIAIWDGKSGKEIRMLDDKDYNRPGLAFTPNDQIVLFGSSFYNISTGKTIGDFVGEASLMVFKPDGKQFATFDGDRSITLWDSSQILQAVPAESP